MKVLFLVTAYPRRPGDVITPWLVETIRRLRERGVEVEVLAPSYRGSGDGVVEGVRVHRFRYAPSAWETLTHDQTAPDRIRERPWYAALVPGYVLMGSLRARHLAAREGFDVVHAFWPVPHGVLGMAAKRRTGIPLVSTFFGVELSWVESDLRALRWAVRAIVRASDAVTVISSHTERLVRGVTGRTAVHRIPFGAAAAPAPGRAEPVVEREPGSPLHLLFVGRLVERKGVHILLEALADPALPADVTLSIVGDGPERPRLEAGIRELGLGSRLEVAGFVAAPDLRDRIATCDALILPAVVDAKGDTEGLGVVLIEALAAGRPVIASDAGGIRDIVRDGETGLLVPPGDPGALAEAIDRYRRDPALARALAERGRRHVEREFSWDVIIDRLLEVYRTVTPAGTP